MLLATLFGQFPFLQKPEAACRLRYQGPIFADGLAEILPYLNEIIKRFDRAKGFVQLPKRRLMLRKLCNP
jgi:hypothetical protein